MSATLLSTAVYKFSVDGIAKNQAIQNVLYYVASTSTPPLAKNTDQAMAALITNWQTNVLPLLSSEYTVARYRLDTIIGKVATKIVNGVQLYKDSKSEILEVAGTGIDIGGKAGVIVPTFDAVGVRKRTLRPGKSYRGSMRLGPIVVADVEEQIYAPAALTTAQTKMTAFRADLTVDTGPDKMTLVVFGRKDFYGAGPGVTNPELYTAAVDTLTVKSLLTSQVSRKEKNTFGH